MRHGTMLESPHAWNTLHGEIISVGTYRVGAKMIEGNPMDFSKAYVLLDKSNEIVTDGSDSRTPRVFYSPETAARFANSQMNPADYKIVRVSERPDICVKLERG